MAGKDDPTRSPEGALAPARDQPDGGRPEVGSGNDSPSAADEVAALVAAGDHVGAARRAAAAGDRARAIALYERAWRFSDALALAMELGDRPLAIRLALDARVPATAARLAEAIPREAVDELRAAAAAFGARGSNWEAARLAERAGDAGLAALHFRRAGSAIDVGRMEELAGRPREAGMAYEQAIAGAGTAEEAAAAHLALGRLLGRLGRHQDAARSLQQAMRWPALRLTAGRVLTAELLALDHRIAAAEIAARLRRDSTELPESPEELAALDAPDAAASTSPVGQMGAEPGLLRRRFKVLRSLGAGATSAVYLAEDTLLGQLVALKLLSVGAGARGAERQAYLRFAREAEAAGRLRHPNLVALHDADPSMGLFVMELMAGGTLADALRDRGALAPATVRRLALDLLSGLQAAHDLGIVHRDIKPANILFDGVGNAKLADFGAAHLIDFGQTQTAGLLGTVAYMSPEQISGTAIGPAADLYALGVTLFEALTGRLPFPGPDIVGQHLGEEPPRPSDHGGGLGAMHDAVILRALRKVPEERWRSAADMAEMIRVWPADAASESVSPPPAAATSVTAEAAASPAATPTDVAVGRSPRGALFRREDPRLGRPVLVEVLDVAAQGETLAQLRALAAAGGPHVQRLLALSDDGTTVTYEVCEGTDVDADALAAGNPEQASVIREVMGEALRAVQTPGGPVLLIVADRSGAGPR